MTRQEAEALWSELREALVNAEAKLIEIIETRAWLPLGYATFVDAWNARMHGFRFMGDVVKAHVVYTMIDEGRTDAQIVRATDIGESVVANIREQKNDNVPAPLVHVKAFVRTPPSPPDTLHVHLGPAKLARLKELTGGGRIMETETVRAIDALIRRLEKARVPVA